MNIKSIRQQFPILKQRINNKKIVYLDNAATTQKPKIVIDSINNFYLHMNAAIHRAVHPLAEKATAAYEAARDKVCKFINAKHSSEIIFLRNTTEAINLVATCYSRTKLTEQDEIIISTMEHHSNIVPWQLLCEQTGAKLHVININDAGEIDLTHFAKLLNRKTKIVAITHVSNVLGTINPIKIMITQAHEAGALVLIDGAQAVAHMPVDVCELDCDFYAFSGHKMYAPTGIGVLYGKSALLQQLPPYQGGGGMIHTVTFAKTEYADIPEKFEAGTPNISGAIALGTAIDYLNEIGMSQIELRERQLLSYVQEKLKLVTGLRIIGTSENKVGVVSIVLDKIHPHDAGTILGTEGVAVRVGHHCAMPLMERFQIPATTRLSLGIYNTEEEIDFAVEAIEKVKKMFA